MHEITDQLWSSRNFLANVKPEDGKNNNSDSRVKRKSTEGDKGNDSNNIINNIDIEIMNNLNNDGGGNINSNTNDLLNFDSSIHSNNIVLSTAARQGTLW